VLPTAAGHFLASFGLSECAAFFTREFGKMFGQAQVPEADGLTGFAKTSTLWFGSVALQDCSGALPFDGEG
jgi:hypothetical protein